MASPVLRAQEVNDALGRSPLDPRVREEEAPRIGSLDGLRAIAIALVLLFHFTPGHDSNQGVRSLPFKLADIGWSGVDLFFVLSGFLITGILLRAKGSPEYYRRFFSRRVRRVLPLYYLALVIAFWIM